jgi:hypothetical protein
LPAHAITDPTLGRVTSGDPNYAIYRAHLRKTVEEPFALFVH